MAAAVTISIQFAFVLCGEGCCTVCAVWSESLCSLEFAVAGGEWQVVCLKGSEYPAEFCEGCVRRIRRSNRFERWEDR